MTAIFLVLGVFAAFALAGGVASPAPRPERELYERRLRDGPRSYS